MKKLIFQTVFVLFCLAGAFSFFLWNRLSRTIDITLQKGWFEPSLEYYSAPVLLKSAESYSLQALKKDLIQRNYLLQTQFLKLKEGEFIILKKETCQNHFKNLTHFNHCLIWIQKNTNKEVVKNLAVFKNNTIHLFKKKPFQPVSSLSLDPVLFAQYEGDFLRIRKKLKLSEMPYLCLQSITITEDRNFLIHKGASPTGIFRALIRNLKNIRIKEGGSTITQQLIKNRFLSSEKTFRRKWVELIMAIILERKLNKDQILELYLNTIYMGQAGPYGLFGFKSASHYYFNTPISRLNLSQCALLSAIVQSPGRLNPFLHPEKARARRDLILKKMSKTISNAQLKKALDQPLPSQQTTEKAPYFIQAVQKELEKMNIDRPLKIYTSIDLKAQEKAAQAIEKSMKNFKKHKPLQVSFIFLDLKTNRVLALIGGRDFLQSQFNRATQAYRPIGSLVKPFVYLTALAKLHLNPLSLVQDEPIKSTEWSPQNYKNKYYGSVPLYFALKESLNTVSARLGKKTGLREIRKILSKLGYEKKIKELPSITLGSIEMSIFEISQMYSTIARMGSYAPLSLIDQITRPSGEVIYQKVQQNEQRFSKQKTAVLLGMMKQVIESGTAKWIRPFWPYPTAGKTGTSNDERDAWFVGFTPRYLTAVWLGYDDNTSHQLTGASGALPIWLNFMKSMDMDFSKDFQWPKGVQKKKIKSLNISRIKNPDKKIQLFSVSSSLSKDVELIFEQKKWYEFLLKKEK